MEFLSFYSVLFHLITSLTFFHAETKFAIVFTKGVKCRARIEAGFLHVVKSQNMTISLT